MSGLYEVAIWLVYVVAALMMLAAIVASILAGLALRLVAEFLRQLGDSREDSDIRHDENDPGVPREQRDRGR
ncbi:MAG: hypothetical protein M3305_14850 [Actinomycetota bacterium]|nr:hypothetical protein [Actinomycetota bacterium]